MTTLELCILLGVAAYFAVGAAIVILACRNERHWPWHDVLGALACIVIWLPLIIVNEVWAWVSVSAIVLAVGVAEAVHLIFNAVN